MCPEIRQSEPYIAGNATNVFVFYPRADIVSLVLELQGDSRIARKETSAVYAIDEGILTGKAVGLCEKVVHVQLAGRKSVSESMAASSLLYLFEKSSMCSVPARVKPIASQLTRQSAAMLITEQRRV